MERQLEEILQRLERTERELQRFRARSRRLSWLTAFAVLAGAVFIATLPTARQVQAAQFLSRRPSVNLRAPLMIVDEAGKPLLGVGTQGQNRGLVLFDTNGNAVCGIGV